MSQYPFTHKQLSKIMKLIKLYKCDWPEDDWFRIGKHLDLNLYVNPENKAKAAVYTVKNRQTTDCLVLFIAKI